MSTSSKRLESPTEKIARPFSIRFPEFRFVDTAIGGVHRRNKVTALEDLDFPANLSDCYSGLFRFRQAFKDHCDQSGSVSGTLNLPHYSDFVWFDIDNEDLDQALLSARDLICRIELFDPAVLAHIRVYFSGQKGFHIGIPSRLFGLQPTADFHRHVKDIAIQIAGDIPIDKAIYDRNRLWRVPFTRHGKSALFKVALSVEELATLTSIQIREKAKNPSCDPFVDLDQDQNREPLPTLVAIRQKEEATSNPVTAAVPTTSHTGNAAGWVVDALASLKDGNRNASFTKITGLLRRGGLGPEEIMSLLAPHADRCSFSLGELERLVAGVTQRYASPFTFQDSNLYIGRNDETRIEDPITLARLLETTSTEIDWLFEGILPKRAVGILAGPPAHGKSWLAMAFALDVATGGKCFGIFPVAQGTVLYIDKENGDPVLARRFSKLATAKGLSPADLPIHFMRWRPISFTDEAKLQDLIFEVQKLGAILVVVDSLIRVHEAEENSASEMSRVFSGVKALVDATGCAVLLIDHTRKQLQGQASGEQVVRGSSDKEAFADSILMVRPHEDEFHVEHRKSRYDQKVDSFAVKIVDTGENQTSVVYCGKVKELKEARERSEIEAFLEEQVSGDGWFTWDDLSDKAKDVGIAIRALRERLKDLVKEGQFETEKRKLKEGRGGKSAFYRRRISANVESQLDLGDESLDFDQQPGVRDENP